MKNMALYSRNRLKYASYLLNKLALEKLSKSKVAVLLHELVVRKTGHNATKSAIGNVLLTR